jgi:hypothetical protein
MGNTCSNNHFQPLESQDSNFQVGEVKPSKTEYAYFINLRNIYAKVERYEVKDVVYYIIQYFILEHNSSFYSFKVNTKPSMYSIEENVITSNISIVAKDDKDKILHEVIYTQREFKLNKDNTFVYINLKQAPVQQVTPEVVLNDTGRSAQVTPEVVLTSDTKEFPKEVDTFSGKRFEFVKTGNNIKYRILNYTYSITFGLLEIKMITIYKMSDTIVLILIKTFDNSMYISGYSNQRTDASFIRVELTNISETKEKLRVFKHIEFIGQNKFNIIFEDNLIWSYSIDQNGKILKVKSN